MVRQNFGRMTTLKTPLRSFVAFEDVSVDPNIGGIYFLVLDKNMQVPDPDAFLNNAVKIIPASQYNNREIEYMVLYSNNDGSDVTLSFSIRPSDTAQTRHVFAGKVVNNTYIACDGGTPTIVDDQVLQIFGHYFLDNTKFAIIKTAGEGTGTGH